MNSDHADQDDLPTLEAPSMPTRPNIDIFGCLKASAPTDGTLQLRDRWFADSLPEGAGFEPSVPLIRAVPEWLEKGARALCAWSAEMRAHP
jgi:hypothetical protein